MSKRYEITTLDDMLSLSDDQIDRLCAELPDAIKWAKAVNRVFGPLVSPSLLNPFLWTDDGKTELRINVKSGNKDLAQLKIVRGEE